MRARQNISNFLDLTTEPDPKNKKIIITKSNNQKNPPTHLSLPSQRPFASTRSYIFIISASSSLSSCTLFLVFQFPKLDMASSISSKPFLGATKPTSSLSSDIQRLSFSSLHISLKPRTHKKLRKF